MPGMEDPRVEEYRSARYEVMKGLKGKPGSRSRYLASIGPFLECCSEAPMSPIARLPYMAALAYGHEDDGGPELPLTAILAAFRASEQDAEHILALRPVYAPEPTTEQERLRQLARSNYGAYLRTEHWKRVRRAALERAGYRCQRCNAHGGVLEVHHRTYHRCGAERPLDVTVLCADCHSSHHGKPRPRPGARSNPGVGARA